MSDPPVLTIPDFVATAARNHPDKLALSFGERHWSFAELHQAVDAAARDLARLSSAHGPETRRVGILSGNRPGVAIAIHAAARAGIAYVPLNWRLASEEIAWQIQQANVGVILSDRQCTSLARSASEGLPVTIEAIEAFESLPATPPPPDASRPLLLQNEAAIFFTSGTSGRPKGARLTYGNLWFSAIGSSLHIGHDPEDVWLAVLPLFHIGGVSILYRGAINGTSIVLHERFAADRALAALDDGITLVSLVPAMLQRMIEQRGDAPWSTALRTILLGGGPAPLPLVRRCHDLGIPVSPTYGLTESASQATTMRPSDACQKIGSSGLPLPTIELRITEHGASLPRGAVGEIELRGPTIFRGYLHEVHAVGPDGWFRTGDAGYLDEDGYLSVVDRRGDMMVSGGENVYPAEIERVLLEHPLVDDAGVIGVPDEQWGTRPIAFVVWRGEPSDVTTGLQRHCLRHLARFKVPDRIEIVPALPRSASGKLLRGELRAWHEAAAEQASPA